MMTNILMIGAAFGADLHMDAYSRLPGKARIVGICGKGLTRVKALAQRYGITDYAAYDDFNVAIEQCECDLVDVCVPNFLHHDVTVAALKRGRDVIVEKPLATTVEDGRAMVETARQCGRRLYYAEDWISCPAVTKARLLIEEGGIGKPVFIRARECHSGSHSPFTQTIEFCGGGSMIHLGVHPIALILAMKNNEWTELTAMTSGGGENNLIHKKLEGEDWATALMRFADGTTAVIEANYVSHGGMEDFISIYGTEGCLHLDLTFSSAISGFSIPGFSYTVEKSAVKTGWSRPAVDEKYNLGYVAEIEHFLDCHTKSIDAKPGLRGVDGLEALEVVNCIYQSAREGRKVVNPKYT
ncbi:MAG: Gfo/Idh/MocA family oxidoreductase [Planctomycetaceae bacterium]|nr:Gfo/Idh/MocA family oxidoreductase [Planctomycetaceae bacterium]